MIEQIASEVFRRIGHTWKLKGGGHVVPTEEDVREVLDASLATLYTEDHDTRLETGGLIIDKQPDGYDVYVYVGNYK